MAKRKKRNASGVRPKKKTRSNTERALAELASVLERHRLLFLFIAEPAEEASFLPAKLRGTDERFDDRLDTASERWPDLDAVFWIEPELEQHAKVAKERLLQRQTEPGVADASTEDPIVQIEESGCDLLNDNSNVIDVQCEYLQRTEDQCAHECAQRALDVRSPTGTEVWLPGPQPWTYLTDLEAAIDACRPTDRPPVAIDFEFIRGQVRFRGQKLPLRVGAPRKALKRLVRHFGQAVDHAELQRDPGAGKASTYLRKAIERVNRALKARSVPCEVDVLRGEGYVIHPLSD